MLIEMCRGREEIGGLQSSPAVEHKNLTRDERRVDQKGYGSRDVFRSTGVAKGCKLAVIRRPIRRVVGKADRSGSNRVDANFRRELFRKSTG